jgi:CRP-like cAMP-binding protein
MGCKTSKNDDVKKGVQGVRPTPPQPQQQSTANGGPATKYQSQTSPVANPGGSPNKRSLGSPMNIPPPKFTVEELEKQLARGPAPGHSASRNELQKYLSKFKILLPKEEVTEISINIPQNTVGEDEFLSPSNASMATSGNLPQEAPEGAKPVRRGTISGKRTDIADATKFQPRVVPKDPKVRDELLNIVAKWPTIAHLEDREIAALVDAMCQRSFAHGTVIYSEGERNDNAEVYFVYRGQVVLQQAGGPEKIRSERTVRVEGHFGDVEVMGNLARTATALAAEPTECYALDEEHLRNMLTAGAYNKRERYVKWLEKIPWLQNLDRKNKIQLADALEAKKYKKGERLIEYGVPGEWMYIIEDGTVDVWGYDEMHRPITTKAICSFGIGDCVGELEFITDDPAFKNTQADVVASTEVRAVRLHQRHFELCLGPLKDLLRDQVATLEKFDYYRARIKRATVSPS